MKPILRLAFALVLLAVASPARAEDNAFARPLRIDVGYDFGILSPQYASAITGTVLLVRAGIDVGYVGMTLTGRHGWDSRLDGSSAIASVRGHLPLGPVQLWAEAGAGVGVMRRGSDNDAVVRGGDPGPAFALTGGVRTAFLDRFTVDLSGGATSFGPVRTGATNTPLSQDTKTFWTGVVGLTVGVALP